MGTKTLLRKSRKNLTQRQWIVHWKKLVKDIIESTPVDNNETNVQRQERKTKLEAEPEEWFKYYFPRFAYASAAQFHRDATIRVLQNREWYEVRIWSRELAKSTRTMMEVLYLTLVGHPTDTQSATPLLSEPGDQATHSATPAPLEASPDASGRDGVSAPATHSISPSPKERAGVRQKKRCVLLISNSLDNAVRLLMPYRANLEYNRRIIQDYGAQKSIGRWEEAEFITRQGAAFRALGAGQSPRGSRNEEVRPDIILFDDVDTDADCLNPEIIARKWRWIEEAAIGTRSVSEATTVIFCGNRIAIDCCIERATKLADHVDEMNIRDAGGASVWPEKNNEVDIDRVLSQKSYAAQQKEYFNNPLTEGSVFNKMAYKPVVPIRDYSLLVCYTDPSYKATNDYKATVLVGRWRDEYHIIKCFVAQATTAEMISWIYRIMDIVGNAACNYYMEEVFMQDVIVKEVSEAGMKTGRTIPIRGDTRRKGDKFTRIESLLEPLHRNGLLYLNAGEKDNPHMQCLADQFLTFAPGSRAHDDGPDAVEGAVWQLTIRSGGILNGVVSAVRAPNDKRF